MVTFFVQEDRGRVVLLNTATSQVSIEHETKTMASPTCYECVYEGSEKPVILSFIHSIILISAALKASSL